MVVDLELASPRKRRQMMKLLKLDPEARQKYSSERLAAQPDVCYRRRPASFPVSFKVEKAECGPNSPASEAEHEVRIFGVLVLYGLVCQPDNLIVHVPVTSFELHTL
jgi:hypothetical protein